MANKLYTLREVMKMECGDVGYIENRDPKFGGFTVPDIRVQVIHSTADMLVCKGGIGLDSMKLDYRDYQAPTAYGWRMWERMPTNADKKAVWRGNKMGLEVVNWDAAAAFTDVQTKF